MRYTAHGIRHGRFLCGTMNRLIFLAVVRNMSEPLAEEICAYSRTHFLSSELDRLSYSPFAMWQNFGSLRAQFSRCPGPESDHGPPVEEPKSEEERSAKSDVDQDEEQHEDPIKLEERESDLEPAAFVLRCARIIRACSVAVCGGVLAVWASRNLFLLWVPARKQPIAAPQFADEEEVVGSADAA